MHRLKNQRVENNIPHNQKKATQKKAKSSCPNFKQVNVRPKLIRREKENDYILVKGTIERKI